jgi:hypothetical protein
MKPILVGAVLFLSLACSNATDPSVGTLVVRRTPPSLELTDRSVAPVYYFAIERGSLAYIDWAPCVDPAYCSPVDAGGRISLKYSKIAGYFPGAKQAVVFWWHVVPGAADALQPDSVRAVVVDL